jgi:predicted metal-dependent peptidase
MLRFDLIKGAADEKEKKRLAGKLNQAADYAINPIVMDAGYKLPDEDLCLDKQYAGMSMEQIFRKLPDDKNGGKGGGTTYVGPGDIIFPDGMSEEEIKDAKDDVEAKVRQAGMIARMRGELPGSIEALLKDLDDAKIDWKARLWRTTDMHGGAFEDSSWSKPNRRYINHGIYVPGNVSFGPGTVVCMADTSGSVTDDELKVGFSEMRGIVDSTKPERVIVLQCDSKISAPVIELEQDEELPVEIKTGGRGGTDFRPPFKWLKDHEVEPQYIVYFTDGEGPFPSGDAIPNCPVIWVMVNSKVVAPFGDTIYASI